MKELSKAIQNYQNWGLKWVCFWYHLSSTGTGQCIWGPGRDSAWNKGSSGLVWSLHHLLLLILLQFFFLLPDFWKLRIWFLTSFIHSCVFVFVVQWLSRVWLFATPWSVAYQTPQSMGFSRKKYWSGLPCPLPGDLPNPGIESMSLMLALARRFFTTSTTWKALHVCLHAFILMRASAVLGTQKWSYLDPVQYTGSLILCTDTQVGWHLPGSASAVFLEMVKIVQLANCWS